MNTLDIAKLILAIAGSILAIAGSIAIIIIAIDLRKSRK